MTVFNEFGTIRVVLNEAETAFYGIDHVLFDESSVESKQKLKNLLSKALISARIPNDASRFLIEIYPIFSGGCEVFFIPTSKTRQFKAKRKPSDISVAAQLFDSDAVLGLCHRLFKLGTSQNSTLYKYCGEFFLTVDTERDEIPSFREFCKSVINSVVLNAKIKEHGTEICRNAVERIGSTLDGR